MNPDSPRTPREDMEIRLVAMLLGELSTPEADALRQELARDPELAEFYSQLQATIPLVREATATKPTADAIQAAPLRLTSPRRETLLGVLKTVSLPTLKPTRRRDTAWLLPMSLAACLVAMLALLGLGPMLSQAKTKGLPHLSMLEAKMDDQWEDATSQAPAYEYALQQKVGERENLAQKIDSLAPPAAEPVAALAERPPEPQMARRYGLNAPAKSETRATELSSLQRSARFDPAPVNSPAAASAASDRRLVRESLEVVPTKPTSPATPVGRVEQGTPIAPTTSAGVAVHFDAPAAAADPELALLPLKLPTQAFKGTPTGPPSPPSAPPNDAVSPGATTASKSDSTRGNFGNDAIPALTPPSETAGRGYFRSTSDFGSLASRELRDSEAKTVEVLRKSVVAESAAETKLFAKQQVAATGVPTVLAADLGERLKEEEVSLGKELAKTPTTGTLPVPARQKRLAGRAGVALDGASRQETLSRSGGLGGMGGGGAGGGVVNGQSVPLDAFYAETDLAARVESQNTRWAFEIARPESGAQPAGVPEIADHDFLGRKSLETAPADSGLDASRDSFGAYGGRRRGSSSTKPGASPTSQPELAQLRATNDDALGVANAPVERYSRGVALMALGDHLGATDKKIADLAEEAEAAHSSRGRTTIVLPSAEGLVTAAPEPATALGFEGKVKAGALVVEARDELRAKDRGLAEAVAGEPVLATNHITLEDQPLARSRPGAPEPQPEVSAQDNAFSTFSLNVSDVSFKLAEASLQNGALPEPATVRTEEFLNALDYRDAEPPAGMPIALAWERARYPFAHNRDLLRLSVKTAARGREPGRPLNLVILLDSSGSMERADRVQIIGECLRILAGQLAPHDKISVVTFSRTARLRVDGVSGAQAAEAVEQMRELTPEGGTNLEDALNLAYATARRHFFSGGVNRVVLLTDGAANLGNVDPELLKQKVEEQRRQGIALDSFGIGWEGFADDLLEVLTRNGDGRYGFINSPEEAAAGFAAQLAGALQVAASDVKVQIEFNPRRVTRYRQLGYAKHQLKKEQFRDNTVDAAEIGAAESGNALYVVDVDPRGQGDLGVARVRFKVPGTDDYREHEWTIPYLGASAPLDQSTPSLRLAAVAGAFAEWLVSSPFAGEVTPDALLNLIRGVPAAFGADTRPQRLEAMIRQAKSISGQ